MKNGKCKSSYRDRATGFIGELDMSIRKALELIREAKSFQCVLYPVPPNGIRWASQNVPPGEFLDEVKAHKSALLDYFSYTDRDLTPLLGRAFDGYLYCLNQMREPHSSASASDCHVSTLYWRSTVKATLQVSNPELKLIEMLLIQSEQLKYLDSSNTALITPEQEQQKYSTDKDAGTAFNYLLSKHRQFVRC